MPIEDTPGNSTNVAALAHFEWPTAMVKAVDHDSSAAGFFFSMWQFKLQVPFISC